MNENLNNIELLKRKIDLINESGWRVEDICEFTNMPREDARRVFLEVCKKHRPNRFDRSQINPTFVIRFLYNKSAKKLKTQLYRKISRLKKKSA